MTTVAERIPAAYSERLVFSQSAPNCELLESVGLVDGEPLHG
jgi:hypothetical protein